MPGNRLAFAVRVGRQDQPIGPLQRRGNVGDALFCRCVDFPGHGEIFVRTDGTVLGRQVADMAEAGQDLIILAQIFVDCLGFSRTFNDDDLHSDIRSATAFKERATW
ncbi:hypothetical protein D3C71_1805660 [compost metagenome]